MRNAGRITNCELRSKNAKSKTKTFHARTRTRRAHDALKVPQFYIDKDTGEAKVPHRVDAETGTYKGRQILEVKEEK